VVPKSTLARMSRFGGKATGVTLLCSTTFQRFEGQVPLRPVDNGDYEPQRARTATADLQADLLRTCDAPQPRRPQTIRVSGTVQVRPSPFGCRSSQRTRPTRNGWISQRNRPTVSGEEVEAHRVRGRQRVTGGVDEWFPGSVERRADDGFGSGRGTDLMEEIAIWAWGGHDLRP
jgi:hypothetical protein